MFGTIVLAKDSMTEEQLQRYQSVYCGLCKVLRDKYGQFHRFTLNFDMTFVVLLLASLYEPEENIRKNRCVFRAAKTGCAVDTEYTEYAADMTILLAYYKCMDDWEDEGKRSRHCLAKHLEKDIEQIKQKYERQCHVVKTSLDKLHMVEKDKTIAADRAIHFSGEMFSEIFVYKEDFWAETLRNFGYDLGRFIYLMDAALDYDMDLKKCLYNPLLQMKIPTEEVEELLKIELGRAMICFEKLPLVQDEDILKNILYRGVWCKWKKKMAKVEE